MDLYLQFGWGMKAHCEMLLECWGGGTIILSPRDLQPNQLVNLSVSARRLNGQVLLDPQFYLPHADHQRLQSHKYWNRKYSTIPFWQGNGLQQQLLELLELNQQLNCAKFILPGLYASAVNDRWLANQRATITSAQELENNSLELIATIALSTDATRSSDQIHALLNDAKDWNIKAIYLICEPPNRQYLIDDAGWLANVVDLVAGLRLGGKEVIVGYCSHQMLIASCASASAIASGTWLNVRSFTSEKFHETEPDSDSRHGPPWYYCPQALSEFKIPTLDLVHTRGILGNLAPQGNLENREAGILFTGTQPTSTGFGQQQSFRHYLQALKTQALMSRQDSFDGSVAFHKNLLNSAESLLQELRDMGIRDRERSFEKAIDTNRAALGYLEDYRGVMLRRNWNSL